jgi:hypothetical protein
MGGGRAVTKVHVLIFDPASKIGSGPADIVAVGDATRLIQGIISGFEAPLFPRRIRVCEDLEPLPVDRAEMAVGDPAGTVRLHLSDGTRFLGEAVIGVRGPLPIHSILDGHELWQFDTDDDDGRLLIVGAASEGQPEVAEELTEWDGVFAFGAPRREPWHVTLRGGPFVGLELDTDQLRIDLVAYRDAMGALRVDPPGTPVQVVYDASAGAGDALFLGIAQLDGPPVLPPRVIAGYEPAVPLVPEHKHRRSPGGAWVLDCHPGCPAYENNPKPPDRVLRRHHGDDRLQRVAASEFAVALTAQRAANDLQRQINDLARLRNEQTAIRDGCVEGIKELRFNIGECRDVLAILTEGAGADAIHTADGKVTDVPTLMRQTMLDVEVEHWPHTEHDAEKRADADAKEAALAAARKGH